MGALGFAGDLALKQRGAGAQPYADHLLALDFKNGIYRNGELLVRSPALLPGYAYGRSGAKGESAAGGGIVSFAADVPAILPGIGLWSRPAYQNLFLNNAVGASQSIAVAAQPHTLSFFGSGSIALSGASNAGPLVGTGPDSRAMLSFTPGAGTLALDVTGTCTGVSLVAGSQAGPILATGAAPASVSADDLRLNGVTQGDEDLLLTLVANLRNSDNQVLAAFTNGSISERLEISINSGSMRAYVRGDTAGGSAGYSIGPAAAVGRSVFILRRRAGNVSFGTKLPGGTISITAESGGRCR